MLSMRERGLTPVATARADTWRVPSATRAGVVYTVAIQDARAHLLSGCSCKAGHAHRFCKHQALVLGEFDRDNRNWIALLDLQAEERQAA